MMKSEKQENLRIEDCDYMKSHEMSLKIPFDKTDDVCDYDSAISSTGYGRYNKLLILASVFPIFSCLLSTSSISLILPSAECELQLSNFHKGLLNASSYIGMIATGAIWGFLSDTLGRQKLLVLGFGLDALFNFIAGLAQNFTVLLLAKLLDGIICAGPYAILMTYWAECNPDKYRASIVQYSGLFTAFGTVLLPLLGWVVLPLTFELKIISMTFNSWRVFLLICSIPSAIAAVTFFFRWESPKFLLSKGRNEEALDILRQMYAINTGNPAYTFPVKRLASEITVNSCVNVRNTPAWITALRQVKPLFRSPYLRNAVLVFAFQSGALLGYNTIRLWMPQLFASILDAETNGVREPSTVCHLLAPTDSLQVPEFNLSSTVSSFPEMCVPEINTSVYLNSIIIGIVTAFGFLGASYVTARIGDIPLILFSTGGSVICCVGMYWAVSSNLMLAFSSVFVTCTSISSTAIISVTILLFPTENRTMAIALVMMFGQIGGVLGNIIFPLLLDLNCSVPFFLLASILLITGFIAFLLPRNGGPAKV